MSSSTSLTGRRAALNLCAAEMHQALDALVAAHRGRNDFYDERGPTRQVAALVGDSGDVPAGVQGNTYGRRSRSS